MLPCARDNFLGVLVYVRARGQVLAGLQSWLSCVCLHLCMLPSVCALVCVWVCVEACWQACECGSRVHASVHMHACCQVCVQSFVCVWAIVEAHMQHPCMQHQEGTLCSMCIHSGPVLAYVQVRPLCVLMCMHVAKCMCGHLWVCVYVC